MVVRLLAVRNATGSENSYSVIADRESRLFLMRLNETENGYFSDNGGWTFLLTNLNACNVKNNVVEN